MIHLVLGGARSGKSRFGEHWVQSQASSGIYIATAIAGDAEMAARIAHHRAGRLQSGFNWQLIEESYDLPTLLNSLSGSDKPVLVDCLTLWLTQCLVRQPEQLTTCCDALLAAVAGFQGQLILISNEVGSGIVPLGELSRQFVDAAGRLNQALAERADKVTLVVAGLPLHLKN